MASTRLASNVFLAGAALAIVGNALHPFFAADITTEEFLAEITATSIWVPLHLGIGLAVVLLTAGLVMLAGQLRDTAGAGWASLMATAAVIGGSVWTLQIAGIDGAALPALAADGSEAAVTAAGGMVALDQALLALSVFVYLGGAFVALGIALHRADRFSQWIRWASVVSGSVSVVTGLLMLLDAVPGFTFIAFRVVALVATIVAVGMGAEMRKAPATTPAAPAASRGGHHRSVGTIRTGHGA